MGFRARVGVKTPRAENKTNEGQTDTLSTITLGKPDDWLVAVLAYRQCWGVEQELDLVEERVFLASGWGWETSKRGPGSDTP